MTDNQVSISNPIDPVIIEDENLTLNKVMTTEPRQLADEDIMKMVIKFRYERARFIEAGEKMPRKSEEEKSDASDD